MPMLIQAHLIDLKLKIYYVFCKCIVKMLCIHFVFKYFVFRKSVTTINILTFLKLFYFANINVLNQLYLIHNYGICNHSIEV